MNHFAQVAIAMLLGTSLLGCPPDNQPNPVKADFTASPVSGDPPLTVSFQNLSELGGGIDSVWFWNFGDGSTSEERNPQHVYSEIGTFSVSLTVMNGEGTDTTSFDDLVKVSQAPQASFEADVTLGQGQLTVNFTDSSQVGTDPISGWFWDFGDGQTSNLQDPSHSYTQPGLYSVGLTVTASDREGQIVIEHFINVYDEIIPVAIPLVQNASITAANEADGTVGVTMGALCDLFDEVELEALIREFGDDTLVDLQEGSRVELTAVTINATQGSFETFTSADLSIVSLGEAPFLLGEAADDQGFISPFGLTRNPPVNLLIDLLERGCDIPILTLEGVQPTGDIVFNVTAHVLVYTQ